MKEIQYRSGDATYPVGEGVKIIVHICNDVGGWGKGFVLSLSRRWNKPKNTYIEMGRRPGGYKLGNVSIVQVEDDLYVANIIGQKGLKPRNGQPPIRYGALRKGLQTVAEWVDIMKGSTVHMPKIGAGLAGGNWGAIEDIIQKELADKDIQVTVYTLPR